MATGTVYGTNSDGTLSICRSKPENYGKGRCFHSAHEEFSLAEVRDGAVDKINEKVLNTSFTEAEAQVVDTIPEPQDDAISNDMSAEALSRREFIAQAHEMSNVIKTEDFKFFQSIANDFKNAVSNQQRQKRFKDTVANVENLLKSDNQNAKRLRAFLGDKINLHDLSSIMVHNITSMTAKAEFDGSFNRAKRVVMTNLNNDMNKPKYIASVLFFGGRCCYCNMALHKGPPDARGASRRATGEHITPLSPESGVVGTTRFGNMALACNDCNHSRGNRELTEWLQSGERIPVENGHAALVLGRIEAFRRLAFYEEYSEVQSQKILSMSNELSEYINKQKQRAQSQNRKLNDEEKRKIKAFYQNTMEILNYNS